MLLYKKLLLMTFGTSYVFQKSLCQTVRDSKVCLNLKNDGFSSMEGTGF